MIETLEDHQHLQYHALKLSEAMDHAVANETKLRKMSDTHDQVYQISYTTI